MCMEYELTERESLYWLLERHRRSSGLNDFIRILLALELEPWLKNKARLNQQIGGQDKGSSKLTEAESWMSGPKLLPPQGYLQEM